MIFSFILLYLLQLNSYTLLLDLLRFSPAWLSSQRVSSIKPALVGHSLFPLLSSCACFHIMGRECFVSSAPNDLCRLIKPSLSWDQGCLMSDHSMGRAPMATFIHRAFHSKGRSKHLVATVLMDTTLLCPGHLTHSHESSLNKQVFIFENAKRMLGCFFPPQSKEVSPLETTKTSSVTPCVLHQFYYILPGMGKEPKWAMARYLHVRYPHCFCWLRNLRRTTRSSKQHSLTNHAGIQFCGLHRTFPRQAISLTVYVASQNSWKNCKLLSFAKCIES